MSSRLATSVAVWVAVSAAGLAMSACAPSPLDSTQSGSSSVGRAQATGEYQSGPAPRQTAAGGSGSATAAVEAFASAYINWTAESVAQDMRALAARSIGQARSAMELAAGQTGADYELQRGGIANTGTVEAIAPLLHHRDRYVVVTRELTTATATTAYEGLKPAWHLAIATVSELGRGRWVVSGWQPES